MQGAWDRIAAMQAQQQAAQPAATFELWPEHLPALRLFRAVETQFRWCESQPTGLDYTGVRAAPAFRRLPRDTREDVFEDVCTMERAWIRKTLALAAERRANATHLPGA